MSSAAPVPMDMDGPPDRSSAGMDAGALVGPPKASPMPDKKQQNQAFIGKIKQWTTEFDDFARQFPAFSKYADQMKQAAIEGMTKTISQQQSEGGQPQPQ